MNAKIQKQIDKSKRRIERRLDKTNLTDRAQFWADRTFITKLPIGRGRFRSAESA